MIPPTYSTDLSIHEKSYLIIITNDLNVILSELNITILHMDVKILLCDNNINIITLNIAGVSRLGYLFIVDSQKINHFKTLNYEIVQ